MSILFINSSPNPHGNTARLAAALLEGKEYETLNLAEHRIYGYGQQFPDDQFMEVIDKIRAAKTIVIGSPLYWHNLSGLLRSFLDRTYGPFEQGEFRGREMYAIVQGAAPEKWMLDACEYTLSRFAGICGFDYKGMVTSVSEAKKMKVD
jgi:multimeric flavodoxin WrbA